MEVKNLRLVGWESSARNSRDHAWENPGLVKQSRSCLWPDPELHACQWEKISMRKDCREQIRRKHPEKVPGRFSIANNHLSVTSGAFWYGVNKGECAGNRKKAANPWMRVGNMSTVLAMGLTASWLSEPAWKEQLHIQESPSWASPTPQWCRHCSVGEQSWPGEWKVVCNSHHE